MAVWLFLGAVGLLLVGAPSWLLFSVLSSAFLALLLLFDAFFFAEKDIYLEGGWEPTVVSGFMQLLPWLVIPLFIEIRFTGASVIAMCAGFLSMMSLVPYFRAMRLDQDAVVVSVMWNVVIGTVPVLAFFILREKLEIMQYVGIAMIFFGAAVSIWERTSVRMKVVGLMIVAVAISSIESIVGKESLEAVLDWESFFNVFLFFALGEGVFAFLALGMIVRRRELSHLGGLVRRFWVAFAFIEGCQIAVAVTSWRAMSLGPVSLTTAIEGLSGPFLMVFIVMIAFFLRRTRYAWRTRRIEAKQLRHYRRKLFGTAIIMVGAYLVAGGG
jgi:drug/metabolite transporter (DMT)-like permease